MDGIIAFLIILAIAFIIMHWKAFLVILVVLIIVGIIWAGMIAEDKRIKIEQDEQIKKDEERRKEAKRQEEQRKLKFAAEKKVKEDLANRINALCRVGKYNEAVNLISREHNHKAYAVDIFSSYKENVYTDLLINLSNNKIDYASKLLNQVVELYPNDERFKTLKQSLANIDDMKKSKRAFIVDENFELNRKIINDIKNINVSEYSNNIGKHSLAKSLWVYAVKGKFAFYTSCFEVANEIGSNAFELPVDALLSLVYIEKRFGAKVSTSIYPKGIARLLENYKKNADKTMLKQLDVVLNLANNNLT